eukprot:1137658-Pelagomonas_calceolata.AAC.7
MKQDPTLGSSQHASRIEHTVSVNTSSEPHQQQQAKGNQAIMVQTVISHPSKHAPHPPVSSLPSAPYPCPPIVWIDELDGNLVGPCKSI